MSQELGWIDMVLGWIDRKQFDVDAAYVALTHAKEERIQAEADSRQLYEALKSLRNEAHGFISMADVNAHGYTNIRVMHNKLDAADAAIRVYESRGKGEK